MDDGISQIVYFISSKYFIFYYFTNSKCCPKLRLYALVEKACRLGPKTPWGDERSEVNTGVPHVVHRETECLKAGVGKGPNQQPCPLSPK